MEDVRDPAGLGRVKARVPHVYGPATGGLSLNTRDIPWALPAGLPAGLGAASGGISWLPEIGDQVWVRFLDGEPEKPVWEWANQSVKGAETLGLHQYDEATHLPIRALMTRYGHALEFTEASLIATTGRGYALLLDNGDLGPPSGTVTLRTPGGQVVHLDDLNELLSVVAKDILLNAQDDLTVLASAVDLETLTGDLDLRIAGDVNLNVVGTVNLTASEVRLQAGGRVVEISNGVVSIS